MMTTNIKNNRDSTDTTGLSSNCSNCSNNNDTSSYTLITTTSQLDEIVTKIINNISNISYITIDTEFVRDTTYWSTLCLIQFSTKLYGTYIIDPLAIQTVQTQQPVCTINLQSFYSLLTNHNIIKVFHACRQDIELFFQYSTIIPNPLFDTQIAAMVLGYGSPSTDNNTNNNNNTNNGVSYDTLIQLLCTTKEKNEYKQSMNGTSKQTLRMTDWTQRPLTKEQIVYAVSDVTYLCTIYECLFNELNEKNRLEWMNEEMVTLSNIKTYQNNTNPQLAYLKLNTNGWNQLLVKSIQDKQKQNETTNNSMEQQIQCYEYTVYQSICEWREVEAQNINKPRKWIMKDEVLQDIIKVIISTTSNNNNNNNNDNKTWTYKNNVTTSTGSTVMNQLYKLRNVPNGFWNSKKGKVLITKIQSIHTMYTTNTLPFVPMDVIQNISICSNNNSKPIYGSTKLQDILKVLLQHIADSNVVSTKIIATNDDIKDFISYYYNNNSASTTSTRVSADPINNSTTAKSTSSASDNNNSSVLVPKVLNGWRNELFGQYAIQLLQGKIALTTCTVVATDKSNNTKSVIKIVDIE